MRDFPIFTTEFGVSSLILKEIPYRGEAYMRIRDVSEGFFNEHWRNVSLSAGCAVHSEFLLRETLCWNSIRCIQPYTL